MEVALGITENWFQRNILESESIKAFFFRRICY
jgi:hypothetical protein